MTKVVVEYQRAKAQAAGHLRRRGKRQQWRELAAEMVRQHQRRVPQRLCLTREVAPLRQRVATPSHTKAKFPQLKLKLNTALAGYGICSKAMPSGVIRRFPDALTARQALLVGRGRMAV